MPIAHAHASSLKHVFDLGILLTALKPIIMMIIATFIYRLGSRHLLIFWFVFGYTKYNWTTLKLQAIIASCSNVPIHPTGQIQH